MNLVEVLGGTQSQRNYAISMVHFCIDMLMPRMQTLDIEVKLTATQTNGNTCTRNGACQTVCSQRVSPSTRQVDGQNC